MSYWYEEDTAYLVCDRTGCAYRGQVRSIRRTQLDKGLWSWPLALCECGFEPRKYTLTELVELMKEEL